MSYIFINALGISELLSRILAACGSVDYLIFACLAYFWIERYGRRRVMMVSAGACSICWICIAIALGLSEKGGDSYVLGSVAVAFFFVFFAVSGPCPDGNQSLANSVRRPSAPVFWVYHGCIPQRSTPSR